MRKNEFENVLKSYQNLGLNVIGVNAKKKFYASLKGKVDPEDKRKAIGKTFIDVFEEESKKIKNVKWLAQGTRHRKKLPVRGQRTRCNARTRKGKAIAIAGKKLTPLKK